MINLLILFIIPTDIMAAYDQDDLRFVIISISKGNPRSTYLNVEIVMIKHYKDEYPVINRISETYTAEFRVVASNAHELVEKRLSLLTCILDLYPNALLSFDMVAWNLTPDESVDQVRQKIISRITPNPIFNESIILGYQIDEGVPNPELLDVPGIVFPFLKMSLVTRNLNSSLTTWGFHATVKASVFSLRCKLLNFISKLCMDKILRETDNEIDYFNRHNQIDYLDFNSNVNLINTDANLNFFNHIVLMGPNKIPSFRTRYHENLQQLPIPALLLKELEDYCPSEEDILYHFGTVMI